MSELPNEGRLSKFVRWASSRIPGLNYRTKLFMSYCILWQGFYLVMRERSITEFTLLAGVVLGAYATSNVMEKNTTRKMATIEKIETGDADVNVEEIPKRD